MKHCFSLKVFRFTLGEGVVWGWGRDGNGVGIEWRLGEGVRMGFGCWVWGRD